MAEIERDVKFLGRVYEARLDRGPTNREFILDDLWNMSDKVVNLPVLYEHGDDPQIGKIAVGTIASAWVEDRTLTVRGVIFPKAILGDEIYNRIRQELLDTVIPMLSIRWRAPPTNRVYRPEDAIADVTNRKVLEISLVHQGAYPEANIIEVAASGPSEPLANLEWNTPSDVLTVELGPTEVSNQAAAQTLDQRNRQAHMAFDPKNFALFNQLLDVAKVPEAERQQIFAQPTLLVSKMHEQLVTVNELLSTADKERTALRVENEKFAAEKKRQHEEYVASQTELAKTLSESYPEEKRQRVFSFASKVFTNPDFKEDHELLKDALTGFANFQNVAATGAQMPAQHVTEVGVTASATHQQVAKRPTTEIASPFRAFLEQEVLNSFKK